MGDVVRALATDRRLIGGCSAVIDAVAWGQQFASSYPDVIRRSKLRVVVILRIHKTEREV
eukprot:8958523-Pyramimonas_sp.AAC.2